ncbi:PHD-finger domain-containing protein [Toxoplasma gondii RUB]|uniref:PHD-finger domain-containing protein n=1 Tax=Toxoplasma gondii RUB TaxID=935652 RepID=A0A086M411_TOXGO|nr:PHD-finger domain-containing protein [Toxoplasma gondii RUB]
MGQHGGRRRECLDFQSFTCRGRTKLPRQRRRAVRCSLFHRRSRHAPRCLSPLTLPVLPSPRSRLRRHLSRSKSGFTRRPRLARPSETQPRQRVCEDGRRRRQQARRRSDSERFQVARWPRRVEAISCRRSSVRVTRPQLSAPPATSERPPAARSKTADTARWNPGSFTRRAVSKKRDSSASPPDACSTAFGPKGNSQTSSRLCVCCSRCWHARPGWQPFSAEFAYQLLHRAGYDPQRALRMLDDPGFCFNDICDPPLRKYDNKWKRRDKRGTFPNSPYPPPLVVQSFLQEKSRACRPSLSGTGSYAIR